MGKINLGRVVAGGLLAGVVLNVYDFVMNGVVLADQWNAAMTAMGKGEMGGSLIAWFVLFDFLFGIWIVWVYAAIRPRFGPGPRTAAIAGLAGWALMGLLHTISEAPMGIFPANLYWVNTIAALVMVPVAGVVGAWPYQETA